MNHRAKLALLYKCTDACWCWSGPLLACVWFCVHVSKHTVCLNLHIHKWSSTFFPTTVYLYTLSKYMYNFIEFVYTHICLCCCWPASLMCVCSDVLLCYLIKAQWSLGELSIPTQPWRWSSSLCRIKCKQLRATSVSIRQTDSSCEQELWLKASYLINWTCSVSREDNATWSSDSVTPLLGFLWFILQQSFA